MSEPRSQSSPRSINVLHYCAGNLFGGVERFLLTLFEYRQLCAGMIPHFAVSYEGELSHQLRELGGQIATVGPTRLARPWSVWATRRRIRDVLRLQQIDVVVSHGCWSHVVLGRTATATAMYLHDTVTGTHWLERMAIRTPAAVAIANSQFTASCLPAGAFKNAPVQRLTYPSSIAPRQGHSSDASRLRKSWKTADDAIVIVMSSRWEPYKGHELLIQSLGSLRTSVPWVVWIVGGAQRPHEAAFMEKVLADAQRLGVRDRIRLLGQRNDVPDILAAADIHCQPNLSPEPFGLTFVEALAAGLTVVTTRHGGGEEILSPDFGLLSPPGDVAALAELLTKAIESPQLRAELAAKGPRRALELCDPARQLARLHEVLRSAL